MNIDNPDYEICLCRRMKVAEIEELIRKEKITSLKELCEIAKVGDKCGGCREELEQLLEKIIVDF